MNKDADANVTNTTDNQGSLLYLWSECKQKVASLCIGCNGLQLARFGSRISLGSSVHFLAFSGRSMTAESK
jgi:hypothetical protein